MLDKYNLLRRWHRRLGTERLFIFYSAYLFVSIQIILVLIRPIIMWFVGIGPGDVAYHPLNLVSALSLTYANLVAALIYFPLNKKRKIISISSLLVLLCAAQLVRLYINFFLGLFGQINVSVSYLFATYASCALMTYLFFLATYLAAPKKWNKKAFKIQDMVVLMIAFFAFSAKLIGSQNVNVSNLENFWLLLACGAFSAQFAKLTFEYFEKDV